MPDTTDPATIQQSLRAEILRRASAMPFRSPEDIERNIAAASEQLKGDMTGTALSEKG